MFCFVVFCCVCIIACRAMPCHAKPCKAMPCHAKPCHAMQSHAMLWHDMTCHDMTWHDMTCHDAGRFGLGPLQSLGLAPKVGPGRARKQQQQQAITQEIDNWGKHIKCVYQVMKHVKWHSRWFLGALRASFGRVPAHVFVAKITMPNCFAIRGLWTIFTRSLLVLNK